MFNLLNKKVMTNKTNKTSISTRRTKRGNNDNTSIKNVTVSAERKVIKDLKACESRVVKALYFPTGRLLNLTATVTKKRNRNRQFYKGLIISGRIGQQGEMRLTAVIDREQALFNQSDVVNKICSDLERVFDAFEKDYTLHKLIEE